MIRWLCLLICLGSHAVAQAFVDPDRSRIQDGWWRLEIELGLSDIVPYRIFTLDAPRRLVIDFEGLDAENLDLSDILSGDRATALRFGPFQPGWSRMVIDLSEPLLVDKAGMQRSPEGADLNIVLKRASPAEFAAAAGAPDAAGAIAPTQVPERDRHVAHDFVVVLDPGHGGIDPGAERSGINEADLMLTFANEVAELLQGVAGIKVVLTRDRDVFVPLFTRMSIARAAKADLFISLHADALAEDAATGASIYTLATDSQDRAAAQLVERHERDDLLSGVDLDAQGDRVATALMDLARAETGPAGQRFADMLVRAMTSEGVRMNSRPRREGAFAVLSAADFPSVLIEVGFLSSAQDRAVLTSAEGRARIARAIAAAVIAHAR
ncbi:N-acetylmuramoyl-L-alanine amidase [Yoonia sp. BS5-3]|uniref:N-acetylmuramoyl-L-alanine amidase n=1 Tax=Yoonia phaeophyticola TaxID=3137369 RepID=A0ABZ2V0U4_9RHOB